MSRDVLVVGGGDPWRPPWPPSCRGTCWWRLRNRPLSTDGFVDGLARGDGTPVDGLDLVVHALYPDRSRIPTPIGEMTTDDWARPATTRWRRPSA